MTALVYRCKEKVSELVKLGFGVRHYELSTIVVTQQLTGISKLYGENISWLSTFYIPNRNDMKIIIDEYLNGISKEEINKIIKTLKNNKYSVLEINLKYPYDYGIYSNV